MGIRCMAINEEVDVQVETVKGREGKWSYSHTINYLIYLGILRYYELHKEKAPDIKVKGF